MRRAVFVLLLVILPFQSVWAAAASYCRHETGPAAKHFGHHEHQHLQAKSDRGADQKTQQKAASGVDTDCTTCHLSTAPTLASAKVFDQARLDAPPQFVYQRNECSRVPPGPERPDRALA